MSKLGAFLTSVVFCIFSSQDMSSVLDCCHGLSLQKVSGKYNCFYTLSILLQKKQDLVHLISCMTLCKLFADLISKEAIEVTDEELREEEENAELELKREAEEEKQEEARIALPNESRYWCEWLHWCEENKITIEPTTESLEKFSEGKVCYSSAWFDSDRTILTRRPQPYP